MLSFARAFTRPAAWPQSSVLYRTGSRALSRSLRMSRREAGLRWLGIELSAVAVLVTVAWLNEPTSLERFALMCACLAPYAYGATVWVRGRLRPH